MKQYVARLANNSEGGRIEELVDPDGDGLLGANWDTIYPWWVVVLDKEEIVACAQLILSHPIGHIEFLCIDESLNKMQRAFAIKKIEDFAEIQLYTSGVFIARCCITFGDTQWRKIVKKRYGEHLFDASVFKIYLHRRRK